MLKPCRRTVSTSLQPGLVARRVVPAQRAEALLDLGPRVVAEGGEAAAGGADQRGEAAADIDMQAHRRLAARQRHHDHVLEVGQLDADRRDAVAPRQVVEPRLHAAREVVALERGARQRAACPTPRLYCLVAGSTCTSSSATSARRMCRPVLGTRSSACAIAFTPIGARAAAEQPQDGDGAGDGGNGADRICMVVYIQLIESICTTTSSLARTSPP